MNTKNKLLILLITLPFLLLSFSVSKTKKEVFIKKVKTIERISPTEVNVFWYSIRVKIDNRSNKYYIVGKGSKIQAGKITKFKKAIWKNLSKRQIVIGPFEFEKEALNSRMMYRRKVEDIDNIPADTVAPTTLNWFAITFKNSERLKIYILEPNPATMQSGTIIQFKADLYEGLGYKQFMVGPFWDYERAEKAKVMYRKNE